MEDGVDFAVCVVFVAAVVLLQAYLEYDDARAENKVDIRPGIVVSRFSLSRALNSAAMNDAKGRRSRRRVLSQNPR